MESATSPSSLSHTHIQKPKQSPLLQVSSTWLSVHPLHTGARAKPHLSKVPVQLSPDTSASLLLRLLLALAVYTVNSPLWTPKPEQNFISMKWKEKYYRKH